ncbi:MAG TPA: BON domain-containing protein [Candidatus Limnocylindrales bacterium]
MASRDLPRPTYQGDNARLNAPDVPVEEKGHELSGEQQEGDQVAYLREDEVSYSSGEFNDTAEYEGYPIPNPAGDEAPRLEELTDRELCEGETDDPAIAAEEGLTWVPPMDPPVVADEDDPEGAEVGAGFGVKADDVEERVREALRADAATTQYADALAIATRNGTVVVRGVVEDIDDTDNVIDVISRVTGVADVIDELEVPGVTD